MCLISVIPKGVKKEESKIKGFIENGMQTNNDGSGYAFKKDGKLYLSKGYRSVDSIVTNIMSHKLKLTDELIIHHRIGTSGKKDNINMHPFVVSSDIEDIKHTEGYTKFPIMAHNGVFGKFSDYNSDFSDTVHFIKDFMSTPELISMMARDSVKFEKLFTQVLGGNKLAFLFENRDLILTGEFKEDDGCFHSNGGYKSWVIDRGGSSSFNTNLGNRHFGEPAKLLQKCGQNLGAGGKVLDFDGRDFSEYTEADWEDYNSHKGYPKMPNRLTGAGIDNALEKLESNKAKASFNIEVVKTINLKFESKDIKLDVNNYNHFIFILNNAKFSFGMPNGKGYEIERFDYIGGMSAVIVKGIPQQIYHLNAEMFADNCDIFVKAEFKHLYDGLFNLIRLNGYYPSKALKKKMQNILNKKQYRSSFKFKGYGLFSWRLLNTYYVQTKNNLDLTGAEENIIGRKPEDYPEHKFDNYMEDNKGINYLN